MQSTVEICGHFGKAGGMIQGVNVVFRSCWMRGGCLLVLALLSRYQGTEPQHLGNH